MQVSEISIICSRMCDFLIFSLFGSTNFVFQIFWITMRYVATLHVCVITICVCWCVCVSPVGRLRVCVVRLCTLCVRNVTISSLQSHIAAGWHTNTRFNQLQLTDRDIRGPASLDNRNIFIAHNRTGVCVHECEANFIINTVCGFGSCLGVCKCDKRLISIHILNVASVCVRVCIHDVIYRQQRPQLEHTTAIN